MNTTYNNEYAGPLCFTQIGFWTTSSIRVPLNKATCNTKHKTMLMLIYSAGLRVSELVVLEITDIYRDIMRILVRQGKGHKDHYTILTTVCLTQLEQYWKAYRPHDWLFPGKK